MNVKDRLIMYIKEKGMSIYEFERSANLAMSSVHHVNDHLGKKMKDAIAEYHPDLNISWLITGEGSMMKECSVKSSAVSNGEPREGVPYYDCEFEDMGNAMTPAEQFSIPSLPDIDVWCRTSKCIKDIVATGDIIGLKEIADWQDYLVEGYMYALHLKNGQGTIRFVTRADGDSLLLSMDGIEQSIKKSMVNKVYQLKSVIKRY
ncbi:MAG: hypothetical protein J6M59_05295 [Bacteroidaceae bacterium]|nr:hypothetical protein [Bacteroidaceae bacterium]